MRLTRSLWNAAVEGFQFALFLGLAIMLVVAACIIATLPAFILYVLAINFNIYWHWT